VSGTGPATGYTVVETVPPGFVATTPTAYSTDLWSRQELVGLPGQAMLPPPVAATIDFDDVDASGGAITGAALESYLNQLGITISDITPSGLGEIVDDRFGFPSQVLRAFSDYNVFWHDSPNAPYAYALNFAVPQTTFSFVRPELFGATPSGLIVSPWRARAFDADGGLLDTVSEPQLAFFGSTPPVPFTLNGPGISSVIFDRTTLNTIAGLNRVPSDNWDVDVPTDPRREILVGSDLMFGNAGAELSVSKVATPTLASPGETVTYTYYVTNTGDLSLTGVIAVDDPLGTVTLGASTLAPDEWTTGVLTYTVTGGDLPGPLVNTVVVTGTPPVGASVTGTVTASVTLTGTEYHVWLPVVYKNYQP
jgi:uncharacterized repeat protein (TIGR01451 family)